MPLHDWIHKYPQVQALLQQDGEALDYQPDGGPTWPLRWPSREDIETFQSIDTRRIAVVLNQRLRTALLTSPPVQWYPLDCGDMEIPQDGWEIVRSETHHAE
jgi:hypothetical protein